MSLPGAGSRSSGLSVSTQGRSVFDVLTDSVISLAQVDLDDTAGAQVSDLLQQLIAARDTINQPTTASVSASIRVWCRVVVELAELLAPSLVAAGVIGIDLIQAMLVVALRATAPRVAAVLTLAGVIVDNPLVGSRVDFQALGAFLSDPPALVDEKYWDSVFADQGIEGTGRGVAQLIALLLLAPDTVATLRRGQTAIAVLPPPPVADSATPAWHDLRERSTGWIPITLPLVADSAGRLALSNLSELRGDFDPETTMSLLFRSQRRATATGAVTDFEAWVYPSADAAAYQLGRDAGFTGRLVPGRRIGLGYDGSAGTWNAAVRGRDLADPADRASLTIGRDSPGEQPDIIFGAPSETRVVVRDLGVQLNLDEAARPHVEAIGTLSGFAVVLTNRWFRSLNHAVGSLLREGVRFDLDVTARVADGAGFSLKADGGLAAQWHLNWTLDIKPVSIGFHSVSVFARIRASEDHFDARFEVRAHFSVTVSGVVTLVLDGPGGWVGWWADQPGDDRDHVGVLPPTGAGLQLDIGPIRGGGFLDFTGGPNDRYGGVITAAITTPNGFPSTSVTGFGLHELTGREGDANRESSFVMVLGATFYPGVPLGWGIFWVGVGVIIGIDRRADTDALRERLTSGTVGNVLFADDPIRNAPVLLGDLDAIFPPSDGGWVIGLTAQFGWMSIAGTYFVRVGIGLIISFPGPIIVVLGSAEFKLHRLESVLHLRIDLVGVVDPSRGAVDIDATIVHGELLKLFTVSGDAAIRIGMGDNPHLIATLGGFHPDYHPEPVVVPKLGRLRVAVDRQKLPKWLSLSGEAYFAVTTNTIQFGLDYTAAISWGNWHIEGKLGGDALIRLPMFFEISIHASVAVKYRFITLAGVSFKGTFSGVHPFALAGEVHVEVLFLVDATYSGSWALSDAAVEAAPALASLVPVLADELDTIANLTMASDADPLVQLTVDVGDRPVFGVSGRLVWQQRRVPLAMTVSVFEGAKLARPQRVSVSVSVGTPGAAGVATQEALFAPGQFLDLSDAEKIALPSFEHHQAGIVVNLAETTSASIDVDVEVEEFRIPSPARIGGDLTLPGHLADQLTARDGTISVPTDGPPRFQITDHRYHLAGQDLMVSAVEAHTLARLAARAGRMPAVQHRADRVIELVG